MIRKMTIRLPVPGALLAVLLAGPVLADKDDSLAELDAAGHQILGGKDTSSALFDQYRTASDALGGYDPYNLRGSQIGANPRAAPVAPPLSTTTTSSISTSPGAAIPDGPGGMLADTLAVSGAGTAIWDIDVTINVTHTWAADLTVVLTSPAGTPVVLTSENGGGNDDVYAGTLFDDQAGVAISQFAFADGVVASPLTPEGALGAFIGEDPNGTWTLEITDSAGLDIGTLNSWSLDVTTLDAPAVLTTVVSTGRSTGAAIPDGPGGTLAETATVSGAEDFICDVDVTVGITHTWAGDLDVIVTSPAGTQIPLTLGNGGGNDNVYDGSLFDDSAPIPVTDFAHADLVTSTPMAPEGALSRLTGENPNGVWSLTVNDNAALDTGNLNSWTIDVTSCRGLPPASLPVPAASPAGVLVLLLLLGGLGALFAWRRS